VAFGGFVGAPMTSSSTASATVVNTRVAERSCRGAQHPSGSYGFVAVTVAIDDVLSEPRLEALCASPTDRFTYDADGRNAAL
jgi:hypothetical protein